VEETRKTIGRYEVRDCIGRGGMGALFRGHDPVLDREVAIKTMLADFSRDEDGRIRFYREARAAARLQHRNIVTLFDFGEDEGTPYIVMEFLHGQTVAEFVRSGAKLAIDRVLDIGAQLCTGLHFAHLRGVVHRDIKPPNIWLNDDGGVKLLDFGIAKYGDTTVTRIGGVVGSVSYMSPEQVSGEEDVDGRSDIFSVGIVLYELLSGQRPFRAESPTGIMMKIVNDPPPPLDVPGLPAQVVDVIEKALAKDRTKRYQHSNEMAVELRNLQILISGRPGTRAQLATTAPVAPASAAAAAAGPAHQIDGESETRAGHQTPFPPPAHDPDVINRWSLGTAEDLVADAVITPPETLAALKKAEARKRQPSPAVPSRTSPEWLTGWAGLFAVGGVIAIAAFAGVLLMRAESPSGTGLTSSSTGITKSPAAAAKTVTPATAAPGNPASGTATPGNTTPTTPTSPAPPNPVTPPAPAPPPVDTDVHVLLTGPYAFSVVDENQQSISGASTKHDLRLGPKAVIILKAPQVYLNQRVTVDGKAGSTMNVKAPVVGFLDVRAARETCPVILDGNNLGYPPISNLRVAAGKHTLTLKCPDGDSPSDTVTIAPNEKEAKLFQ
jgi:Protein kinase domain